MKVLAAIALIVALCIPALGAGVDLVNGKDGQSDIRIGAYHPSGTGNMDYVREYDGRELNSLSIEYLNMLGYNGPWQYSVFGRYLFAKDADSRYGLSYRNLFGATITTSTLTHRLGTIPSSNPFLIGTPAAGGADFLNLSPDQNYFIDRQVDDFNVRFTPGDGQSVRLVTNWWMESEDGWQQRLFRARQASSVIGNGKKGSVALPVDRNTTEATIGTDVRVGNAAVVNYNFSDTKFGEGNSSITPGSDLDFLPLNQLTMVDSDTKSSIIKVRTSVGNKLFFTGVQTDRQRDNTRASLVNPTSMSINSTNAALTYLLTDSITLTGRYRRFDQDNDTAPVLSGGSPTNMALSDGVTSSSLEATYTGLRHAFLKMGYERRDTDRTTTNGDPSFPFINASTKANVVTGGFRYYPNLKLSLSGNAEVMNADSAGYAGTADEHTKINANATYMYRDNAALFADYNSIDERNSDIRVPWADIPATATNADQQELREEAAGQGYKNKSATTTIGTWYALTTKLVLDANFATIRNNAATAWIIGTDPLYQPHIAPDDVAYEANNNQWSTGATYSISPKWRVYGRYLNSRSTGRSIIDPSKFPGNLGPTWSPVDVAEHRYTIGFALDMTIKDSLSVDYSLSDWTDHIDSSNNGTYNIWQVAWSRQF